MTRNSPLVENIISVSESVGWLLQIDAKSSILPMCPSGMRSPSPVSASIPKIPKNLRSFLDSARSASFFNIYVFGNGKLIAIIRVAYDDT